jgi:hypothetical protein
MSEVKKHYWKKAFHSYFNPRGIAEGLTKERVYNQLVLIVY